MKLRVVSFTFSPTGMIGRGLVSVYQHLVVLRDLRGLFLLQDNTIHILGVHLVCVRLLVRLVAQQKHTHADQGVGQKSADGHHLNQVTKADQEGQDGSQTPRHDAGHNGGVCQGRHISQEPADRSAEVTLHTVQTNIFLSLTEVQVKVVTFKFSMVSNRYLPT